MNPQPESSPEAPRTPRTVAERRMHLEQALASTRIEGHQPSAEFLADMEALITGQLSDEEVRAGIVERARVADRLVAASGT
jgi:hypothetical protein